MGEIHQLLEQKGKIKDVNFRYNNKKLQKNFLVLYEANKNTMRHYTKIPMDMLFEQHNTK